MSRSDCFLLHEQPPLDFAATRQRFRGRSAVVAGGASGIGRTTAERLASDGVVALAILDVNESAGEEAAKLIREQGCEKCFFFKVDVTDAEACKDACAAFVQRTGIGYINCLVNSVAYFGSKSLNATADDWRNSLDTNVMGYSNMVQAVHPHMIQAPELRSILNVSSISAWRAQRNRWTYSATKGAVSQLTRAMALDLSADSIRVNSVSPGFIWSPEEKKASHDGTREGFHSIASRAAMLSRDGDTSEVAAAITFLLSLDASFITGADLPVDGGYLALGPEGTEDSARFAGTDY